MQVDRRVGVDVGATRGTKTALDQIQWPASAGFDWMARRGRGWDENQWRDAWRELNAGE